MEEIEKIWEPFSSGIKNFIRRRVDDEDTVEDLTQEVFIRVHQNVSKLKESDKLESWIYQIARNAIIDYYRSKKQTTGLDSEIADSEDLFIEADAVSELGSTMRGMVETLPEPYRDALVLTEYQGLTQQQLANQMCISLSGAKSRVQRAKKMIRDELLQCCHFEFDRYGRVIDYWGHCCCCASNQKVNK
jgi:RNA polymerase sigma-70 factor, ECF subfamily